MVIDSSALLAILFGEAEQEAFVDAIAAAGVRLVSALTSLEASIVVTARKGPAGVRELDLLFHNGALEVVPFTEDHFRIARSAYQRYGKGRHPAALNLGDCCSYALARFSGHPLLFKGEDFAKTDIRPAFEILR